MELTRSYYNSPVGIIEIEASDAALHSVKIVSDRVESSEEIDHHIIAECKTQLEDYFSGKRTDFSLQLHLEGTDFQKEVWKEVSQIPFGKTSSYLELSKRMNKPDAVRAVGLANGKNKFLIIIPCHRVIGSQGELVGYAGGLQAKKILLDFEAKHSGKGVQGLIEFN